MEKNGNVSLNAYRKPTTKGASKKRSYRHSHFSR